MREKLVCSDVEMALAHAPGTDHLRWPCNSHKVNKSMPVMEERVFLLQQQAVVLTTVNKLHAASPVFVGRALEKEFRIPTHLRRVTSHDTEDFLVYFNLPARKDMVARRGTISVDGSAFIIELWREDVHALHQSWMLHVGVVFEKLPMHLWSLEGAKEALGNKVIMDRLDSRTFEHIDMKLLAVCVWVWELAHIPTHQTLWKHARGTGRVEVVLGFLPPSHEVTPPSNLLC
ncbi:Histidyl-tRNA synthetase [Hordeum vulgare]|nr:Histidyl-tRNA synthetase [Hordeum vulgare]